MSVTAGLLLLGAVAAGAAGAAGVVASAGPSWVAEYPRARAAAAQACKPLASPPCRTALLRLSTLLDSRTDIIYKLAKIEAGLGEQARALPYLELYARSQLDLGDPAAESALQSVRTAAGFAAIERRYRAGLAPVGTHAELSSLPEPDLIAEDLALDARDGARYVSSVHAGKVLKLGANGKWSTAFPAAELNAWGIYALTLDAGRDRLWMGTSAGAVSPPFRSVEAGHSAILRASLGRRRIERRYRLDDGQPHAFGDMALGVHGEVFIADGAGGGVFRIGPEDDAQLEMLVRPGSLLSPQTPAPLPDGSRLLIPDYGRGIAMIDLHRRDSVGWLPHPPELALYGIDGLYLRGRTLIAIQNGTVPERLLLLRLNAALTRIVSWKVALARAPGLGDPTHGVVHGERFEFISNSGWDRVADDGHIASPPDATRPAIWSIALPAER